MLKLVVVDCVALHFFQASVLPTEVWLLKREFNLAASLEERRKAEENMPQDCTHAWMLMHPVFIL